MDIQSAVKSSLSKMLNMTGDGMKVLMVDEETLKIVSLVASMSEIMERDVYLIERINYPREPLDCLTCVCFLRPTKNNIRLLSEELRSPTYNSYYIFFSHSLSKQLLKQLASSDELERVIEVEEVFADFFPVAPNLFELDIASKCYTPGFEFEPDVMARCVDAITSILLSFEHNPVIRYQNASEPARRLANMLRSMIQRETVLFDSQRRKDSQKSATVLILDRRFDTITPLLNQWTYEAMIHELIGIHQNRVTIPKLDTGSQVKSKEVTLCNRFDSFFATNQFANYGEIGKAVKELVSNVQSASKSVDVSSAETITDLKKILEAYPAYKKASVYVETHVALIAELCRIVKQHNLFEVSELEQELACSDNSSLLSKVKSLIKDPRIQLADALRLVLLYSVRFNDRDRDICDLCTLLIDRGASASDVGLVEKLRQFTRQPDAVTEVVSNPPTTGASGVLKAFHKRLVQGLNEVENVYTRHRPRLHSILTNLLGGKLPGSSYPNLALDECYAQQQRPTSLIVFMIGGVTYEEYHTVHQLSKSPNTVPIVLGGTCIHNSKSFLDQLMLDNSTQSKQRTTTSNTGSGSKLTHKSLDGKGPRYTLLN